MSKELALLKSLVSDQSVINAGGIEFITGHMGRHDIVMSECGIGKVNAALCANTVIEIFRPDLIINSGVAGGANGGAGILDVVVADRVAYHDVWCGPGTNPGQAAGCPQYFDCPIPAEAFDGLDIKRGLVASGDEFICRKDQLDKICATYTDVMAVDMESAAIAHVCYRKDVPFVCIRVISDTPGAADNISQYENFWSDAPAHTFSTVRALIDRL